MSRGRLLRDFFLPDSYFFAITKTMKWHLPKSIRIHIRKEKSRIRALVSDTKEAEQKIRELTAEIRAAYSERKKP